jgi:hypothetical protein
MPKPRPPANEKGRLRTVAKPYVTVYGYARVSTDGQSVAAQVAALRKHGAGKVFREVSSGGRPGAASPPPKARGDQAPQPRRDACRHRPQLQCQPGDDFTTDGSIDYHRATVTRLWRNARRPANYLICGLDAGSTRVRNCTIFFLLDTSLD